MRVLLRLIDADGRKWYAVGHVEEQVILVGDTDTKGKLQDMVSVYDFRVVTDDK